MSVEGPGDRRSLSASNWRPTRTAVAASALVATGATLALAVAADGVVPAASGLFAGLCLAAAVRASAVAERRAATLLAGALAAVGGLGLLAGGLAQVVSQVGWPPTPPIPFLEVAPFVLSAAGVLVGFATPAAVWGVTVDDVGIAGRRLGVVSLVPAGVLFLDRWNPATDRGLETAAVAVDLLLAREGAVAAGSPVVRVGGFLFLTAIAAFAARAALGRLPLVELADEDARGAVESAVGRLRTALGVLAAVCGVASVLPVAFGAPSTPAVASAVSTVAASSALRGLLVGVALVGTCCAFLSWVARAAASERFRPERLPVAAPAAGALLVVAVVPLHGPLEAVAIERASTESGRRLLVELFGAVGSFAVALAVVTAGLALATLFLWVIRLSGALRLLEGPVGAPLAGAGVLVGAIGAGIADAPIAVVVFGVASSLLTWDLGEFARRLGEEVGRRGRTRRGELVHAAGGGLLAVVAGLAALGANAAIEAVPPAGSAVSVLAAVAAAVGTVLLFVAAR